MSAFVLSIAALLSIIVVPATIAGGVTESEARAELDAANADLNAATNEYQDMVSEVDRIDANIAELERDMAAAGNEFDKAATALDGRMKVIYKYSDFSSIELILASHDFDDFTQRLAILSRLAFSDTKLMKAAMDKKALTQKMEDDLAREKNNRLAALVDVGGKRRAIESQLKDKEGALTEAQNAGQNTGSGNSSEPQAPTGGNLTGNSQTGDATYYFFTGGYTAAHRDLPMGTMVRVTNLGNGATVWVEIVDRGPWAPERVIDLEETAFAQIADLSEGVVFVLVEW